MAALFPVRKVKLYDLNQDAVRNVASTFGQQLGVEIEAVRDPGRAIQESDICVTCTPADRFFVQQGDVAPGTFIAAVGADDWHKQEIDPALMSSAKVVADNLEQVCAIGDTHHAIAAGLMRKEDIYADLSEIITGRKPGRTGDDEITIFDSTGVAIEDAAAATLVYEKARAAKIMNNFEFAA